MTAPTRLLALTFAALFGVTVWLAVEERRRCEFANVTDGEVADV